MSERLKELRNKSSADLADMVIELEHRLKQKPVATVICHGAGVTSLKFDPSQYTVKGEYPLYAAPPDLEQRLKEAKTETGKVRDILRIAERDYKHQLTAANEKYIILKVAVEQAIKNYQLKEYFPQIYWNLQSALPTEGGKK